MSTRVRCTLNYGGMRYGTMHQVIQTASALYRQQTGKYYLVKKGTTPLWKYLMEMVERIPDWPEGAKLRIWREKRGGGGHKKTVEVTAQRTTGVAAFAQELRIGGRVIRTGRFYEGTTIQNPLIPPDWQTEVPREER